MPRQKPSFWVAHRRSEPPDLSHLWPVILFCKGIKRAFIKSSPRRFTHSCFHMGKEPVSLTSIKTYTEKMFHCCKPTMNNHSIHRIPPASMSWKSHIHRQHCHSLYFLPSQPETLSDFKNTPSSPHFLPTPLSLPLYPITWPQQEGNICSQATRKSLTECFVWQGIKLID